MTENDVKPVSRNGGGRLFVLSGPSGVGKGSLLGALLAYLPGVRKSVSATTRAARPAEVDGVDYHFLSRDRFVADIAKDRFFEYAEYNGNYYGTPCEPVEQLRALGLDVFLEIEVQGARIVRTLTPDAILIFVQPPSLAALEERLRMRGTDSDARIAERLRIAESEISCLPLYDYAIVNDDFDTALNELRAIVIAERRRLRHGDRM
jgi:guanylate kinase